MTDLNDKRRAIYDLQRRLLCLHNAGYPIPEIVPDGVYGKETENAVTVFQNLMGIEPTGRVGEKTWNAVVNSSDAAMRSCGRSEPIYPYEYNKRSGGSSEEYSDLWYIIQIILRTLASRYELPREQPLNGTCDADTASNVRYLQRIWRLPETGEVDLETWNMLASSYNLFLNRE